MPFVAIVGAGEIGGAAARALASRARVQAVRLIDEQPGFAAGKALDLKQAGPIGGSDVSIEGSTDLASVVGASVIVVADTAAGEWSGEAALGLLRRLSRLGCLEDAVLICAGAGHLTTLQQGFDELGFARARAVGSAPEAFASTARALAAVEAGAAASQVSLTLLGRPPDRIVIPWMEGAIAGHAVTALLSAPQMTMVERRLRGLWPPGPSTLGTAAALFCEAVVGGSRRSFSAFVSLDRDNGTKAPVCAWPVMLGAKGLERVTTPSLTTKDRVVLDEVLGNEAT